jgi:hypothetical protein
MNETGCDGELVSIGVSFPWHEFLTSCQLFSYVEELEGTTGLFVWVNCF